ncbi:MAG: tetratricopeptide repeat protein [Magnetococcales bacterium]|nr:tetratricopeptide repeat protein [Magnetococcales bacterium]
MPFPDLSLLLDTLAPLLLFGILLYAVGHHAGRQAESRHRELQPEQKETGYYYRGLNFLLSDEHDRAIEEFIKVVRINSETVEIHLSLGNLFRARGEVGRAIRIHQNIIARPNLPPEIRAAALFALAEDYRQGGFLDRAVTAYRQVLEVDDKNHRALEELMALHENEGRWDRALRALKRLEHLTEKSDPRREAHLRIKLGQEALRSHDQGESDDGQRAVEKATDHFKEAIRVFPGCVEAYRQLGEIQLESGQAKAAIRSLRTLKKTRPSHFFMVVDLLRRAYEQLEDEKGYEVCMSEAFESPTTSPPFIIRWSRFLEEHDRIEEAIAVLEDGMVKHPGSAEIAFRLMRLHADTANWQTAISAGDRCLEHLTSRQHTFQCSQCGFRSHDIYWKCPQCHNWDTMEPLRVQIS